MLRFIADTALLAWDGEWFASAISDNAALAMLLIGCDLPANSIEHPPPSGKLGSVRFRATDLTPGLAELPGTPVVDETITKLLKLGIKKVCALANCGGNHYFSGYSPKYNDNTPARDSN